MKINTLTLSINYTANALANKCNERTEIEKNESSIRSASCPIGVCACPFEDIACEDVSPSDWNSVLKEVEVPFKKGELVAVRDNPANSWIICVFCEYNNNSYGRYKYRVYTNIDNLIDSDTTNYIYCEKLSAFSKKFFFE